MCWWDWITKVSISFLNHGKYNESSVEINARVSTILFQILINHKEFEIWKLLPYTSSKGVYLFQIVLGTDIEYKIDRKLVFINVLFLNNYHVHTMTYPYYWKRW